MNRTIAFSALLCLSLFTAITSSAQGIMIPTNAELNTKEDYAKYESTIIEAAKWLEATDLNKEEDMRIQVNAFVLRWVNGSPSVSVVLAEPLLKLIGKNEQLLMVYIAGYARNVLENKASPSSFNAVKAGLTSIMNVYKKNIQIKKSKEMDKLIKLADDGKIDEYVTEKCKDLTK